MSERELLQYRPCVGVMLVNREGRPWIMVCRPLAEVEGWAAEAGFGQIQSQCERHGLFSVTRCHKRANR